MKLRVFQNHVGRYNILNPSEKSFEFSMGIVNNENKIVEIEGIKARLSYSNSNIEDSDIDYFKDPIENLDTIFNLCFKYSFKVLSTVNYKAETFTFIKVYNTHFREMDQDLLENHKVKTQQKIDQLQKELQKDSILYDINYDVDWLVKEQIKEEEKSLLYYKNKLSELKEDSESYLKYKENINKLEEKIDKYYQFLKDVILNAE